MKAIVITLLCGIILFGCKPSYPVVNTTPISPGQQLAYWEPVFLKKSTPDNMSVLNSFERQTRKSLDSLFANQSAKYRIAEKLILTKKTKVIENDINSVFDKLNSQINSFPLPDILLSSSRRSSTPYVMILIFKPTTTVLGGLLPYVNSCRLEVVVFDTSSKAIVFYDTSYSGNFATKNNQAILLTVIDDIYSKLSLDRQ